MSIYRRNYKWIRTLSPFQLIALFYLFAVTIATILLSLPIAYEPGVDIPFIDTLFVAVSAVSVTGLTPVSIPETFSIVGYFMIALMLQFGGIGIMTLGTIIWIVLGKKIGLRERQLIMTDQNQSNFSGIVRLVLQIVLLVLLIEFIGFLILGTYFLQYYEAGEAYLQGFFGAVSAMTNGGFDITGASLIPFQDDYFVQFINMMLIIAGAIGFPVLIEVKQYLFESGERTRFSLFAKLTTITFFALIVLGAVMIVFLEFNHFFEGRSWHEIIFYALFQSVTTRSGGLSTMDVSQFTEQTHLFMSSLMFIGASPSSVGGGIRTTTFALVVIFILTFARGKGSIRIFRREVHNEDLNRAVVVTLMAVLTVFFSVLVVSIVEPFSMSEILFEICSAFGTVGLSLGITSELTTFTKLLLMGLMFIGRIGILTFLFSFKKEKKKGNYHYPKERVIIG
ncbi:TrkH family potassium uptake protein [Salimicrobium flavidum]|uniref:Trk-type K+ transport system, membrane component n=1 Tax=Salimicrobium flavidum TaxID=570947 RepID=A0A1N7IMI9_9BACI|nr:TrkH family potassium uptake protein [Salimicrobium flavidum]SIS38289.1 Trk-type K+ transport system, membrane component [Salimicrobium flavidum]